MKAQGWQEGSGRQQVWVRLNSVECGTQPGVANLGNRSGEQALGLLLVGWGMWQGGIQPL